MSSFVVSAIVLCTLAVFLVVMPWLFARKKQQAVLSNEQIVKQRLGELERELQEELITIDDKHIAEKELKLALVDEQSAEIQKQSAGWMIQVGGLLALLACLGVYWQVNQIEKVNHWQGVTERLPELSKVFTGQAGKSPTSQDLRDFALATRTKLINEPEDAIGWFLLGYLYSNMNVADNAIDAYEKSLKIDPSNTTTLSNYAQLLLSSSQEEYLTKAKRIVEYWLTITPNDLQATGMLAVVSEKLGDKQSAIAGWRKLQNALNEDDPMRSNIEQKLASLTGGAIDSSPSNPSTGKSVDILVTLADGMRDKLPENGFVFIFAQDGNSEARMPAAVIKQPLSAFPLKVNLSDANAMLPSFKLSNLQKARLVARVSLDENVQSSPGELFGQIVVELTDDMTQQTIVINEEIL